MVVAPGELTDGGEAHGHASLLANLTEQLIALQYSRGQKKVPVPFAFYGRTTVYRCTRNGTWTVAQRNGALRFCVRTVPFRICTPFYAIDSWCERFKTSRSVQEHDVQEGPEEFASAKP